MVISAVKFRITFCVKIGRVSTTRKGTSPSVCHLVNNELVLLMKTKLGAKSRMSGSLSANEAVICT